MTKLSTRVTAQLAASALVASGLALTTFTPAAHAAIGSCVAATDTVNVFGFNDFHGRLSSAPKLLTPVEAARAANGEDNVLLLSSGDNIGASTFESMILDDDPALEILNAADLDVSTVGNHEFDKGWSDLAGRVTSDSEFSYLGANVYNAGTTTVAAPLKAYELFEKGGVTIAVVGAVTGDVPSLVSPGGIETLTFGDPVAAVNRVTTELLDGNAANGEADVVIASFHEGAGVGSLTAAENAAESDAFDAIYNDVDPRVAAIFNAHTHQVYNYATTDSGVPVIQGGSYGERIAQVNLSVDAVNGGVCDTSAQVIDVRTVTVGTSPRITAINEIVTAATASAAELGAEVIGSATDAISTAVDGSANNRNTESPMANMVAQMFYDVLSDGDEEFIGLQNAGGTRDSFNAGDITYREAALTLPFANSLYTTQITGAQFITVLEQQWQRNADGTVPSRAFLQLALSDNVSYTYDESLPEGERITGVFINGEPIVLDKLYTVGSGSFLISGGDNFRELGNGVNTRDTGRADLEAWVDWVSSFEELSPDYSKRGVSAKLATGTLVEGGPALTYTFGVPLEGGVAPQTLDMALNPEGDKVSPQLFNDAIVAFIGDVEVGQGTVTDGVATIKIQLPDGADVDGGEQIVTFVVLDSGTVIHAKVNVQLKNRFVGTAPYTLPGNHTINGRQWRTTCEVYSQTERCRTEIWASVVKRTGNTFTIERGWAFNNLTYLPFMTRAQWKNNPLGVTGTWKGTDGQPWRTECDTAATGGNGCRTYRWTTVYEAILSEKGGYDFKQTNKWVFNNLVLFGSYDR